MKIPANMTEEQVLKDIAKASESMGARYKFGFYDKDDLEQECFIWAVEALEKYNGQGPLVNFLRVHIKNQLLNLRRNKLFRYEPPCLKCPFYDPYKKKSDNQCTEFVQKDDCDKWASYSKRNGSKMGIMEPVDIDSLDWDNMDMSEDAPNHFDLRGEIEKLIPANLRGDFLRLIDGAPINKNSKKEIQDIIRGSNLCQMLRLDD